MSEEKKDPDIEMKDNEISRDKKDINKYFNDIVVPSELYQTFKEIKDLSITNEFYRKLYERINGKLHKYTYYYQRYTNYFQKKYPEKYDIYRVLDRLNIEVLRLLEQLDRKSKIGGK